jgi:hypothetical protein
VAAEFDESPAGAGMKGIEADGLGELGGRLIAPLERGQHVTKGDVELRVVGTEAHRHGELSGGLIEPPLPGESQSEMMAYHGPCSAPQNWTNASIQSLPITSMS